MNRSQVLLKFGRILMDLLLALSVLSSFLKIGVILAYFKLVGNSELDNALLNYEI